MLGERQDTFDVKVIDYRVTEFHFHECELLAQLIALTLVSLSVNCSLM
jgi:hypothetical protein